jgi:hypothetical protein
VNSVTPLVGAPVVASRLHLTQMWLPSPGEVDYWMREFGLDDGGDPK